MVKKEYKQTEIGVIPEDWETSSLSAAFQKLEAGVSVNSDDSLSSEYHILKTSAVHDGVVDTAETKPVIPQDYLRLKCPLVKGSIIISRMNTPALVGECGFTKDAKAGTYLPDRLWQIQNSNKSSFDFVWLNYLLNTKQYRDAVRATATGTSNSMKNISKERLLEIEIPRPPISEQENIAAVLSEVDELINLIEKQISKKKAIKQGAMQELLTGKRRLPGFDGKWQSFVFGDLFDFIPNNAFTRAQMDVSGRVKNIHYGDILTKYGAYISANRKDIPYIAKEIDLSRFSEKCYLQSGDLVIADTAEDETVGKALEVINVECPVLAGQHTLLCRPKVRFAEKFLGYYLNASCYHNQLLPYIVGTKVSSVSKASIAQTKLVVPKYEEQQAIASILSDMDDEITELEHKLAKYRQVKQGMMQQLLTGKIRLTKDIEDSVQAEQVTSEKAMPLKPVHNHQFDDAVAIAAIVDAFYSDKYPLGRVKVQKLLYLLHRHQGVSVSDFKKKAAGPYADTVRYKGGEPIAKKNKYIVSESGKQGTRYSKGKNMGQALDYVERWGMQADLQWLKENFLHTSRNDLELFATVDMAMCDLDEVRISVSVESIKNLIASNKEWKAKLSKTYFSDWDIARAIKKCTELFN